MQEVVLNSPVNIRIYKGLKPNDYFEIMVIENDITIYPCGENLQVDVPSNHTLVRNYQRHITIQECD